MNKNLTLIILTPEKILLTIKETKRVSATLSDGSRISIYPYHAPLIAETKNGFIQYEKEGINEKLNLYSGIIKVEKDLVKIFTDGFIQEN